MSPVTSGVLGICCALGCWCAVDEKDYKSAIALAFFAVLNGVVMMSK